MTGVSERLGDEERGRAVQPRRDLVHEQARHAPDHHLPGGHALLLASRDPLEQVVPADSVNADVQTQQTGPGIIEMEGQSVNMMTKHASMKNNG